VSNLGGTDLSGAHLSHTYLSDIYLGDTVNLTQEQLDETCGTQTAEVPIGLMLKRCP
jgi:hypothetical protein